jgi:type IV secretory pathway VirJ component
VIRQYLAAWNKSRVLLVGYSFGADTLPFIVNRLPADLRPAVATVSLLGISANASFEIRVAGWIGAESDGPIGKGHRFSGEYTTIADKILAFAKSTPPGT